MSSLLMLDTNAVSAIVKGRASALTTILNDRPFCISVVTEAELRFGLARRPVNPDLRRIVENFLVSVDSRPWTSASAQRYGSLRTELENLGKPLAPMDLLIATHALAEDCILVSADRAFTQVSGLRMLDWSANSGPTAANDPAQRVRDELARAEITPADLEDAVAHARTTARPATQKPGKKPKAK